MFNKKIITVTAASALLLAMGATVAAGGIAIQSRDGEPDETLSFPVTCLDENGKEYEDTISHPIKKVFTFEKADTCNEIEFKVNSIPSDYNFIGGKDFGDPKGWNSFLQGETKDGALNVEVFYVPSFGPEGGIYLPNEVTEENYSTMGDYETVEFQTEMVMRYENYDQFPELYERDGIKRDDTQIIHCNHFLMYSKDGYVISLTITGSEGMDVLKKMAESIEVRKTDKVVKYDSNVSFYDTVTCGVG